MIGLRAPVPEDVGPLTEAANMPGVRAITMYEAAGFVREGLKRADTITDGRLEDTLVMGRLRPAPLQTGDMP